MTSEQFAQPYLPLGVNEINHPDPNLGEKVLDIQAQVDATRNTSQDPAFEAYKIQTLTHLQHVSFDFRLADDSNDYVHPPVLAGPYPEGPTINRLDKAQRFLNLVNDAELAQSTPFGEANPLLVEELTQHQKDIDRIMINNPNETYQKFQDRIKKDDLEAPFPEFEPTLDVLIERIANGDDVASAVNESYLLKRFREQALAELHNVRGINDTLKTPTYLGSIQAIETALEFFDIMQRAAEPMPSLYHSGRYEYYMHFLVAQPDHILYPTVGSMGATDLLKLRQVPIGVAGVNTTTSYVDGFLQSSYEFFHHDLNHSRRMFQFFKENATKQGLTVSELAAQGNELMGDVILPSIKFGPDDSEDQKQLKRTGRMITFEVLHEDALPATREVIVDALFRNPLVRTPFERIINDCTIEYFMEPGASTLAYVFRKLNHSFYDKPGERMTFLGPEGMRNRYTIVNAAMDLFRNLGGSALNENQAMEKFEQLVSTDEGFPEAFFDTVEKDIKDRSATKTGDFGFFVALPETADQVIKKVKAAGKHVITLFGYSDLGYAQPRLLDTQVKRDLANNDPATSLVVIGGTAAGIGQAYDIAKDQGFETHGIVSTKVLSHDGTFSPNVDELHLVRDTLWGGYLPNTTIASPTTEAFVGSADILLAYGGGNNTAVALREAHKRGIPIKYEKHAMGEDSQSQDPYGPADAAWQDIANS